MRVCVTRKIPALAIDLLKAEGWDVSVSLRERALTREELLEFVQGSSAILCLLTDKIDAEVFAAAGPTLKIVANYAIGFDNVDLKEAKRRGIVVTNTPSPRITQAVAEHTFVLILALAKRLVEADNLVLAGEYHGWDPNLLLGTELAGKTLGIIGLGRIGSIVARMAAAGMGMKVLYTGPSPKKEIEMETGGKFLSLDDLLRESDFVTLHVPLTDETRHLINAEKLNLMKRSAFLINTARGSVVDERDLVGALKGRIIAGAALDVFEFEPSVSPELMEMSQVVLTPHLASATKEARAEMSRISAENIVAVLSDQPPLNPAFVSS